MSDNPAPQDRPAELQYLPSHFDDDDLARISSMEEGMALGEQIHGSPAGTAADLIGTGFVQLKDDELDALLAVKFYLLSWRFAPGDYGDSSEFVAAQVITKNGDKYIITDGGTGIYRQLKKITEATGRSGHIMVDRGLRKSEYKYCQSCQRTLNRREAQDNRCGQCDSSSNVIPATTRYLDTSRGLNQ